MRRECRERFPLHRPQRTPLVNDPGMHHGTCVTHVPWCMSGSLFRGGGENVPGIPNASATPNFRYLARGPWPRVWKLIYIYYITPTLIGQTHARNDPCTEEIKYVFSDQSSPIICWPYLATSGDTSLNDWWRRPRFPSMVEQGFSQWENTLHM